MAKAELLFVASRNGLVVLSNPGGIGRWLRTAHTLQGQTLTCVWANPQDPTHVICGDGTQLWHSHDGAQTWQALVGPACTTLAASRTQPQRIMASDGQSAWLSHDTGSTWHQLGDAHTTGMAGELLWYDQMQSHDGGQTWHQHDTHIVAASYDGKMMVTRHPDGRWYGNDTPIAPPPTPVSSWAVCAGQPWTCVMTSDDVLWRYRETWQRNTQIPAHLVHASIYHPDQVWAASRSGSVWLSTDRGDSWLAVRHELPTPTAMASARLV